MKSIYTTLLLLAAATATPMTKQVKDAFPDRRRDVDYIDSTSTDANEKYIAAINHVGWQIAPRDPGIDNEGSTTDKQPNSGSLNPPDRRRDVDGKDSTSTTDANKMYMLEFIGWRIAPRDAGIDTTTTTTTTTTDPNQKYVQYPDGGWEIPRSVIIRAIANSPDGNNKARGQFAWTISARDEDSGSAGGATHFGDVGSITTIPGDDDDGKGGGPKLIYRPVAQFTCTEDTDGGGDSGGINANQAYFFNTCAWVITDGEKRAVSSTENEDENGDNQTFRIRRRQDDGGAIDPSKAYGYLLPTGWSREKRRDVKEKDTASTDPNAEWIQDETGWWNTHFPVKR